MSSRQLIPRDLADVAPGPRLAAVLSGIDLTRLSGFDCVEVLKARYRQINHERAQLMAAMVEVGLCGIGPDDELSRMTAPDEFSADEVRAALVLTRRAADAHFWLAHDLISRLPAVFAAMDAGMLDEPRARVLSEWTTELSPQQARALCDQLLPRAPGLTTGQLIEQLKKMAIAIDPDWARRRYEQAVAERKVVGYRNPDGSANLSGLNLPVDRVAAACGRIDALARAAKHAGDRRPIDHIRADLFLGMTDGSYAGLDDTTILELFRATQNDDQRDSAGSYGETPDQNDSAAGDGEAPDQSDSAAGDGEIPEDIGGPDDGRGPDDNGGSAGGGCPGADDRARRGPAGAGMELRVRLSTLLGLDECPGELAGWGPVHAELARAQTTVMTRGQWRFAITDECGQLVHCGITTARPTGWPTRWAGARQIVELQVPAASIGELASDPDALGGWAPVVTDLAGQYASVHRPTATGPANPSDPTRRSPGAALRRYLQIRDRSCVMIGCRAPARSADADHTLDHAHGGSTTDDNLGHTCRHDHRLKHDGGWRLDQPESGHFRWTSRLGHTYYVHPRPIIQSLPDPICRDGPAPPLLLPPDDWDASCSWDGTPSDDGTPPAPRPPPQPDADKDPPPF